MYASIEDVRGVLPAPITIGDENIGTPSPGRPTADSNRSKLSPDQVLAFIRMATQDIDAKLRPYYVCPLRRIKNFETEILGNVFAGTNVEVRVNDSGPFAKGQLIRLQNKTEMETNNVVSVRDLTTIVIDRVKYNYQSYESKISILAYPDPVPLIAARFAASFAFDMLFSADQSPNISEYGKEQRKLAMNSLDSVLSGTVLLFGQDHTGRRFVRGSLFDAYQNPTPDFQFGRERT